MQKFYTLILVLFIFFTPAEAQVWKLYTTQNSGLISNSVKALAVDHSGNVWIGTLSGLSKFDGTNFTNYTQANGLAGTYVKAVVCDHAGNIWIGTTTGLSKYDGTSFTNYTTAAGLPSNNILSLAVAQNGDLWIGTSSGLSHYLNPGFYNYYTSSGLISNNIPFIAADSSGNVWAGTNAGVSKFNGVSFSNFNVANGLPGNSVKALYGDSNGNVWIGTTGGLVKYFGTITDTLKTSDGLISNEVRVVGEDEDGRLYFGYNMNGLTRYNGTVLATFNIRNGFPFTTPTSVTHDGNLLYLGCSEGFIVTRKWTEPMLLSYSLDTNNINAGIIAGGTLFEDNPSNPWFETPKGSGKHTIFSSTIWLGGFDQFSTLHVSAMQWNGLYPDFSAGPITNANPTYEMDSLWNRVWFIQRDTIDYHSVHWSDTGYVVPQQIAQWPWQFAPWVDFNTNSIYEPHKGDYPDVRGDEAVFTMFHDLLDVQGTGGQPLGVQINTTAYSFYSTDSAIANTVFVNYQVRNYSPNTYEDFYLGVYGDLDIGEPTNDYVGSDSLLSLSYTYNGTTTDAVYGTHPAAQGLVFLSSPMSSCGYFNNSSVSPDNDAEYYNLMNGYYPDGSPFTYGGAGIGGTQPTDFVFSGDPANSLEWSEVSAGMVPADRRIIASVGPFALPAGKGVCIDVAFPAAIDYSGTNISSVTLLKQRTADVITFYNSQGWQCGSIDVDTNMIAHLYIQEDTAVCSGGSITCQNIIIGGIPPYSYQWSPGSGISNDTLLNPVITPLTSGMYSLTCTDSQGHVLIDSFYVTVSPSVVFAGNDTIVCNNIHYYLYASPGYTNYVWSTGQYGPYVPINTNPNLVGTFSYSLIATNDIGCTAYDTVSVTYIPGPIAAMGPDTNICFNQSLTLYAGCVADNYLWNTGGTGNSENVDASTLNVDHYNNIILIASNLNGCFDMDSVIAFVFPAPEIFLGNDTIICSDATLVLDAGPGYNHYNWNTMHTGRYLTIYADTMLTTTYHFDVLGWNDFGCEETDEISVTVDICSLADVQSAGILRVFPIPLNVGNALSVSVPEYPATVCIVDGSGKVVLNTTVWSDGSLESTRLLNAGEYIIEINNKKKMYSLKLIVQ